MRWKRSRSRTWTTTESPMVMVSVCATMLRKNANSFTDTSPSGSWYTQKVGWISESVWNGVEPCARLARGQPASASKTRSSVAGFMRATSLRGPRGLVPSASVRMRRTRSPLSCLVSAGPRFHNPRVEHVETVVIGAGQAGLSASHELTGRGIEHVVLERGELGHTWRTRRWRSFRIVSPNSLNLLPGGEYDGPEPDAFLDTAGLLDYLERYAASFAAPIRTATTVSDVRPADDGGFSVHTTGGELRARHVVVATGAFGDARMPAMAANLAPGIHSIHTDDYWAPEDLPEGGVLVVGAGQSGLQIADELARAGRAVTVAVGRHGWVPRRVYGRDQMHWRWDNGDYRSV